jgi:hypothetical protein
MTFGPTGMSTLHTYVAKSVMEWMYEEQGCLHRHTENAGTVGRVGGNMITSAVR